MPKTNKRAATRLQSQYDLYQLPFFDRAKLSTWNVTPTGDYGRDCETGVQYAIQFMRTCDGSFGWASLLTQIVRDIAAAGGERNGVVVGFMSTVGKTLTMAMHPSSAPAMLEAVTEMTKPTRRADGTPITRPRPRLVASAA